ncbi:amidohydrolase family protein [Robertkochia aurantiaca]|uniref:amidohydrolase family protein n=1 Tax=Robertkochia aurantiaca TaxID=2873700 RepID=UPI001CCEC227|nr:amidohydrolase family protein [Robertkochia sp. 3YJGBD-33]
MKFFVITIVFALTLCSCLRSEGQESQTEIRETSANYSGPIIDMHIHAFKDNPGFATMLGQEMPPRPGMEGLTPYTAPASYEEVKRKTFEEFKKHHIVKAMASPGINWYDEAPETIIIGADHTVPVAELRKRYQDGRLHVLAEIAPNYDGLLPTHPSLEPYYDLAVELQIPMGFHLFPGGPQGGAYGPYPKVRASQGKPLQFEEILLERPSMKIYIMHAAWPYLEDLKALMYAHPQVYVGVGVICWNLPREEFHSYLKGLIEAGLGKRVMFGSDQMIWPETIETGIKAINSADFLTPEQKEDIFYNNAARFLELSPEEIERHKAQY